MTLVLMLVSGYVVGVSCLTVGFVVGRLSKG